MQLFRRCNIEFVANFLVDGLLRCGDAFCKFLVVSVEGSSIQMNACKFHFCEDWKDLHFELEKFFERWSRYTAIAALDHRQYTAVAALDHRWLSRRSRTVPELSRRVETTFLLGLSQLKCKVCVFGAVWGSFFERDICKGLAFFNDVAKFNTFQAENLFAQRLE